jgi:hypothetical protein
LYRAKIIFRQKTVSRGDLDHLNSKSFLQDGAFCSSRFSQANRIAGWAKARLAPRQH